MILVSINNSDMPITLPSKKLESHFHLKNGYLQSLKKSVTKVTIKNVRYKIQEYAVYCQRIHEPYYWPTFLEAHTVTLLSLFSQSKSVSVWSFLHKSCRTIYCMQFLFRGYCVRKTCSKFKVFLNVYSILLYFILYFMIVKLNYK